ncbi:MAG: DNA repair protein RecN [Anaerolineaceae bacterium]|nr:DNA repair protein RecN [Anaerolineaceae bacterium]
MLTELRIENFAIIHRLELEFGPGLTTLTGETGAGKSIILDAIESLLGGRADAAAIRSGADRAVVEGAFRIPETVRPALMEILEREDLVDDPHYLVLERDIRREGRNVARVNGRSASLSLLRELGAHLVDIHGQSEHLSLLNPREHLGLLDRFTGDESLLAAYTETYHQLQAIRRELANLRQAEQDAARRSDLLNYQVQEIDAAQLIAGEDEELHQERTRLANAESLATLAQEALVALDEGSPEALSITDLLGQVAHSMASLARIDASMTELSQQAELVQDTLAEITRDLRDYLERIEFNPHRLEQIEERLALIQNLKRKYGGSVEAVLEYAETARQQLNTIAHAGERIGELQVEEERLLARLAEQAQALSERRHAAAGLLAQGIETELNDLRMAGARFSVDFQTRTDPHGLPVGGKRLAFDVTGMDRVEFLIAPNPGEGLKSLARTASGGETSRLMLALKNVLARADTIPTLIFDEIDQGIGGRVGMTVGQKLWQLGRQHQVFCVTHLPQLAAFGNQHLRVNKQVIEGRTSTQVEVLTGAGRREELAQMLGSVTEGTLRSADEILASVRQQAQP